MFLPLDLEIGGILHFHLFPLKSLLKDNVAQVESPRTRKCESMSISVPACSFRRVWTKKGNVILGENSASGPPGGLVSQVSGHSQTNVPEESGDWKFAKSLDSVLSEFTHELMSVL